MVTIRGHPHTILRVALRQVDHYGDHVVQVVLTARTLVGPAWKTPTIPRGGSAAYSAAVSPARSVILNA